ncbi:hypothetical protein JZ751_029321 [Albula glossodonta]|uniref:Uncharacterized protein n=1 Tax=Albula glossodonta TaxID=121402 RepID=A0A8T2P8Q9_9TELE|nr:hypothetical protein JZ751_029321 [Albula glossodonta]
MKCNRLSQNEYITSPAHSLKDHGKEKEKMKNNNQSSPTDRAVRICSYSGGSSSNSETDPECDATATCLSHDATLNKTRNTKQDQDEDEIKKNSMESHLSIMDYYQQEVLVHYRGEERGTPNNCLTDKKKDEMEDLASDKNKLVFPGVSLESLNKLNRNGGLFPETEEQKNVTVEAAGINEPSSSCSDKPAVDNLGSLSDSLYDSLSSCTSQGSDEA